MNRIGGPIVDRPAKGCQPVALENFVFVLGHPHQTAQTKYGHHKPAYVSAAFNMGRDPRSQYLAQRAGFLALSFLCLPI